MTEEVLLYSMHWPTSMPQDEVENEDDAELKKLNNNLTEINSLRAEFTFESEQLHKDIAKLVVDHDTNKNEGDTDVFCTDLFDYYEGSEQHPIGYHPTRSFDMKHTNLRGGVHSFLEFRGRGRSETFLQVSKGRSYAHSDTSAIAK